MSKYIHLLDGSNVSRGSILVIDDTPEAPIIKHDIGGSPLCGDGKEFIYAQSWTLGPCRSDDEAQVLALAIAERYGYDIMIDGKLARLPHLGKPGKWVTPQKAGASLGRLGRGKTSKAKAKAARANGKKGGRPRIR